VARATYRLEPEGIDAVREVLGRVLPATAADLTAALDADPELAVPVALTDQLTTAVTAVLDVGLLAYLAQTGDTHVTY